jgi:hypothetical protein
MGGNLFCYVNADIIFDKTLSMAVEIVSAKRSRFVLSGQRWNVDIREPLRFSESWESELAKLVDDSGEAGGLGAMDYFVFTKGILGKMPPFAVGRTSWDNWMLAQTRKRLAALVDASQFVRAVHQDHDYDMIGHDKVWKGPESVRNLALMGDRAFTLHSSTHLLTENGLQSRFGLRGITYRLWDLTFLYRFLRPVRPLLRKGKDVLDAYQRKG